MMKEPREAVTNVAAAPIVGVSGSIKRSRDSESPIAPAHTAAIAAMATRTPGRGDAVTATTSMMALRANVRMN